MYREDLLSHNWLIKRALNVKVAPLLSQMRGIVVDLGCGERPFASEILTHAQQYVGADWCNSLHKTSADFFCNLNLPLPLLDSTADWIVSFEVLEHLHEPRTFLLEAFRVLRPRGRLLLTVPFQWWLHEAPWDYFRYTRYGLHHVLEEAGFEQIQITPTTGFWTTWILKLNYQTSRLVRGPRIMRTLTTLILTPFWYANQLLAGTLDRVWPDENETAGYVALARKP